MVGVRSEPAPPRAAVGGGLCTPWCQQQWRDAEEQTEDSAGRARWRIYLSTEAVLARMFTATSAALESPALHHQTAVPRPFVSPPGGHSCHVRRARVHTAGGATGDDTVAVAVGRCV